MAAERGWSVEVPDLRTLLPLDTEAVLESVPPAAVIVHEAPRTCGYGAELSATIAEHALTSLRAPVLRVTGWDTPFPTLEHTYLPDAKRLRRHRTRHELLDAPLRARSPGRANR